jgi:hypothetical protein
MAPIIVKYSGSPAVSYVVAIILLVAVGWAILRSKKRAVPFEKPA